HGRASFAASGGAAASPAAGVLPTESPRVRRCYTPPPRHASSPAPFRAGALSRTAGGPRPHPQPARGAEAQHVEAVLLSQPEDLPLPGLGLAVALRPLPAAGGHARQQLPHLG